MDDLKLFAVAGNPVLTSKSPLMFRRAFDAASMNAVYIRLAMRDAGQTAQTIRELGISGATIASPFRGEIIPFLDKLDKGARKTGAANIVVNDGGSLTGYNTEYENTSATPTANGGATRGGIGGKAEDAARLLTENAQAFRIFTGHEAPLREMEKALHEEDRPRPHKICVIGFMGAGKSSIGPAVAVKLSIPHVDVDASIEKKTGRTIGQIFTESGEEVFRRHEKSEIEDILGLSRCVVAAGGGSVLDGESAKSLKDSCLVVWLFAGLNETRRRIGADSARPLAFGKKTLDELFTGRIPVYARTCHLLVKTDETSIDEVAERIVYESDKAFGG
jgi:shikimate kinase